MDPKEWQRQREARHPLGWTEEERRQHSRYARRLTLEGVVKTIREREGEDEYGAQTWSEHQWWLHFWSHNDDVSEAEAREWWNQLGGKPEDFVVMDPDEAYRELYNDLFPPT